MATSTSYNVFIFQPQSPFQSQLAFSDDYRQSDINDFTLCNHMFIVLFFKKPKINH